MPMGLGMETSHLANYSTYEPNAMSLSFYLTERRSNNPKLVPHSELKPSNQIKENKGRKNEKEGSGLQLWTFPDSGQKILFHGGVGILFLKKKKLHHIDSTIWFAEGLVFFTQWQTMCFFSKHLLLICSLSGLVIWAFTGWLYYRKIQSNWPD